jgi:hypothetical protein
MNNNDLTNDDTLESNITDDIKGPPPPRDLSLEIVLCLEIARLYDEEDLTAPPHSHIF